MKKASVLAIVIVFFLCLTNQNAQDFTWKKTEIPSVGIKALTNIDYRSILFVITSDNKIYRLDYDFSSDYESIEDVTPDSINNEYTSIASSEYIQFVGTNKNGIYKSIGYGWSWDHIIAGFDSVHITSLLYNLFYSKHVLAGSKNGLYISSDRGDTWSKAENQLNCQEIISLFKPNHLPYDTLNRILASTKDSGVYVTFDLGLTFEKVDFPLSPKEIINLFYNNYDTIFAVSDSNIFYYNFKGDTTWKKFDLKPPSNKITSFICYNYDTVNNFKFDKKMIATFDRGILNLENDIWKEINDSLINKRITTLVSENYYYFITSNIFAGTESDGVYRIQLKLLPDPYIVLEDINSTDLTIAESNDWLVKLILNLTTDEYVNLELYDLQGNKVKDIFKDYLSEGEHNLDLDISGLQSGIYFIKLQMNGRNTIKKMMVVR